MRRIQCVVLFKMMDVGAVGNVQTNLVRRTFSMSEIKWQSCQKMSLIN